VPGRLDSKVAVVTGSSSGHGRAISIRLASEGAAVVCVDVRRLPLEEGFEHDPEISTDEAIATAGGHATFVEADVCNPEALDDAAATAIATFGRLDIWVNNAGTFQGLASLLDETPARFDRTIEINLKGTWHGCRAAVRKMLKQEPAGRVRGRLVNIGSIAGQIGQANIAAYSASKAAVHNLTRALAIELAPELITVNAIAPGYFPTAMNRAFWDDPQALAAVRDLHPLPLGIPEDVAAAAAFLASSDADFVTGVVLPVDGGVLAK
jgi:NAD(P)-dependent dehydrogenase (short-subunit alcohol dehydrogenase family)